MTAATEPRADLPAPARTPLADWMRSVGAWLGPALGCRQLRLVWLARQIDAAEWIEDAASLEASTLDDGEGTGARGDAEGSGPGPGAGQGGAASAQPDRDAGATRTVEAGPESGWLLPLAPGRSGMLCLFCAGGEHARACGGEAVERAQLAVAASWSLASPCASEEQHWVVLERDEARAVLHELRNALNALLMNAATLSWRPEVLPDTLRPFARQLQVEGERCSEALRRFGQLLDGHRAAAAGD